MPRCQQRYPRALAESMVSVLCHKPPGHPNSASPPLLAVRTTNPLGLGFLDKLSSHSVPLGAFQWLWEHRACAVPAPPMTTWRAKRSLSVPTQPSQWPHPLPRAVSVLPTSPPSKPFSEFPEPGRPFRPHPEVPGLCPQSHSNSLTHVVTSSNGFPLSHPQRLSHCCLRPSAHADLPPKFLPSLSQLILVAPFFPGMVQVPTPDLLALPLECLSQVAGGDAGDHQDQGGDRTTKHPSLARIPFPCGSQACFPPLSQRAPSYCPSLGRRP